ncbi:hypothetical protein CL619_04635 [archaeon]|nr:hypothetical protein [archaeon]
MTNIHKQVQANISADRAIQKDLERNLINVRALARYLQKKGVDGTIDSIISAIRRFEKDKLNLNQETNLQKCLSSMIVSTKSNILSIELKDAEFKTICEDFIGSNILKKNTRLIKAKESVTIFLNQKEFDNKKKLFAPKNVLKTRENLAEIRIIFPEQSDQVIGLLARIGMELSLENVSIEGIIETMPEILLYVKEKDLILAHKAVMSLSHIE